MAAFVVSCLLLSAIGAITNSPPVGICGTYGPAGSLLLMLLLATVLVSGVFYVRRAYRNLVMEGGMKR